MPRHRTHLRRNRPATAKDEGVIIVLVAIFLLFVVGAMAALSIDITSFYTARSEAQLAADSAALAGARVLANSGMTSSAGQAFPTLAAENLARSIATQVARQNQVGGGAATTINVTFPSCDPTPSLNNPCVTVKITRTDLPTFFARVWGTTQVTVNAQATAEAYNPSGLSTGANPAAPVAPLCVKPWLLPNLDPVGATGALIFSNRRGRIVTYLVGQSWPSTSPGGNLDGLLSHPFPYTGGLASGPAAGQYYAAEVGAAANDFPEPTQALPAGTTGFTPYEFAVAACVPQPIPCGLNAFVNLDTAAYTGNTGSRDSDTIQAVETLIHFNGAAGDTDILNGSPAPALPFEFVGGNQNPVVGTRGSNVLISDSLVTVPVYESTPGVPPGSTVTVIGFLQLFLNPQSALMPATFNGHTNEIPVTIINQLGCGTDTTGTPVFGNGPSAVAVRLVSPP